jgi:hypothetical protein
MKIFKKCITLATIVFLMAGMSGCTLLAPTIFFPKTSVHGVVLDQHENPVPDVKIEVRKHNPMSIYIYNTGVRKWSVRSNKDGKWHVSARKLSSLYVEAIPPKGYEVGLEPHEGRALPKLGRANDAGPFHSGQSPTNSIVLKLRKLDEDKKGDS